jgi:hypothetical protein
MDWEERVFSFPDGAVTTSVILNNVNGVVGQNADVSAVVDSTQTAGSGMINDAQRHPGL